MSLWHFVRTVFLQPLEQRISLARFSAPERCCNSKLAIDSAKADMTIFDSSGIEAFVTENNPKYANRIIKQLKAYAKAQDFDKSYDPYKAAYGSMPPHASANPEIKQLYINGHF